MGVKGAENVIFSKNENAASGKKNTKAPETKEVRAVCVKVSGARLGSR